MRVQKFNKDKHFCQLVECLVARGSYIPRIDELPRIGYASFDQGTLVAAAFLRKMEGGYAQIDGLTSNPRCTQAERHEGIDLVVSQLLKQAKQLSISHIMFTSQDSGTIMRSQKYGFKKLPLAVLAVDLTKRGI